MKPISPWVPIWALIQNGEEHLFEGIVRGQIATEKRGTAGFGYDPVFAPEGEGGKTFAELGVGVKNHISHRARAVDATSGSSDSITLNLLKVRMRLVICICKFQIGSTNMIIVNCNRIMHN